MYFGLVGPQFVDLFTVAAVLYLITFYLKSYLN